VVDEVEESETETEEEEGVGVEELFFFAKNETLSLIS